MFLISEPIRINNGIEFVRIRYNTDAGQAIGRAVFIDPIEIILKIYPFYEIINKSFEPGSGVYVDRKINSGPTLPEFVYGEVRDPLAIMLPTMKYLNFSDHIYDKPGKEDANNNVSLGAFRILPGESKNLMQDETNSCLFACNTIQTNFVGPNGFVFVDGKLIYKPWGALALNQKNYKPLNGKFSAFIFDKKVEQRVVTINIEDNLYISSQKAPVFAISGPALISDAPNAGIIQNKEFAPDTPDVVNWDPATTRTSFTAFGTHSDGHIVCLSMFEELWGLGHAEDKGISVKELANLLFTKLGVIEAVLGGGSADTQQYIKYDIPKIMVGPKRKRKSGEGMQVQVEGMRGLGAILGAFTV